jgi:hypothetical protein
MLLSTILPGPKEQDADQVQRYMRIIVNELLRLWNDGFLIDTPEGQLLVRVLLLCICCDKPAAHKMGGFGGHSHRMFCTRCKIEQKDKTTSAAYTRNGEKPTPSSGHHLMQYSAFEARTHNEMVDDGLAYARATTLKNNIPYAAAAKKAENAGDKFVKERAARWAELARLPYFNLCRMIVIDPMHAVLLGTTNSS